MIGCECQVADPHLILHIKIYGLQPLILRRFYTKDHNMRFLVLDGIKRFNAALLIGYKYLPAYQREYTDKEATDFLITKSIISKVVSKKSKDDWSI